MGAFTAVQRIDQAAGVTRMNRFALLGLIEEPFKLDHKVAIECAVPGDAPIHLSAADAPVIAT